MIKANELMLCNLVQDEVSGELMIVDEIGENIGATLINRDKYPLADGWQMSPIALTSKWLDHLGFKERSIRIDKYSGVRIQENGRYEFMDYTDGQIVSSWDNRIEYVHQLQNLYFALCGEELTLKQTA